MLMEEHSEMAVNKVNRKTLGLISAFGFHTLTNHNMTSVSQKEYQAQ